ncbi:MAG: pyridine nucleotide-disulfide oxidoreductase [Proteobacteria bacterium]|nr:MAG: pyridine nucleotide-disulfide oxidoreductase [Pseudomonadota bacterium]
MATETLCIIGAGQTGGQAVATLRQVGYDGRVVLIGAEPHLPYHRPALSNAVLQSEGGPAHRMFDEAFYDEAGVELRLGRRVARVDLDARVAHVEGGDAVTWDKLLVATGAAPERLGAPGEDLDGVLRLRTLDDAEALRARLGPGRRFVVVGGGFIGLQLTATAHALGCDVTVLEASEHLLHRVAPPEIAGIVRVYHATRGVRIITEAPASSFEADDAGRLTHVRTGDGRRVPADVAVICCGVQPNTRLAEEAGLDVDDGILVDASGRTSHPAVWAAGDCTSYFCPPLNRRVRLESWQNARDQATVTARAIAGDASARYDAIPSLFSQQGDMRIELLGVPERIEQVMLRGRPWIPDCTAFYLHRGCIVAAVVFNRDGDVDPVRELVRRGARVHPRVLLDDEIPLGKVLAEHL